jgi:hypothetical protein
MIALAHKKRKVTFVYVFTEIMFLLLGNNGIG